MGSGGYFLHHLPIKRHAAFDAVHFRQQPVVKSPAASQPVSVPIKGDRREPESNRTLQRNFRATWPTARECRISRRQCPSLDFEPAAPNRFGWRSRKRAGRRFFLSAAIFPATARYPVRPAAARRTKSCAALCNWGSSRSQSSMDSTARTAGEIFCSAARICFRSAAFLPVQIDSHFSFFFRAAASSARHFSTRSLIFFSTPCSVGW